MRDKLDGRAHRIAYNFFKRRYATAIHREPFTRFLETLMDERRGKAREHAAAMAFNLRDGKWPRWGTRHEWLERYFVDEPEMRARLTSWLDVHAVVLKRMADGIVLDVYGRYRLLVERDGDRWRVLYVDNDGKRGLCDDIVVPPNLAADEIADYVDDLLHESAAPGKRVRRIP